ncbi:MAG: lactonase family protein [Microscillaceae bacterium]|nr:lactonase family protein [Microscillaceae bacterium]
MKTLKISFFVFITSVFFLQMIAPQSKKTENKIFYTYISSAARDSEAGIILFQLDAKQGKLTQIKAFSEFKNSGYLCFSPNQKYLYAIGTTDKNESYVAAYAINRKTGDLTLLNHIAPIGNNPCYVSVDNSGKYVMTANYSGGDVRVFSLDKSGRLTGQSDQIQHEGKGIRSQQESAHPHMIISAPKGNMVLVPDLGMDKVMIYSLDAKTGKLTSAGNQFGAVPQGAGPRHFVFHPKADFAYSINELAGSVTAYKHALETNRLDSIQTISTLPADFQGENFSADIHISPDGKYLYASNRGPNTLAVMEINATSGKLRFKGTFPCGGDWPRAFGIDPSGQFILVNNQKSNDMTLFKINLETGFGEPLETIAVKGPLCVKFLEAK